MVDYTLYANSCGIKQKDMVRVIHEDYPHFGAAQMSLACNPWRNAVQLIPEAEEMLVNEFGKGPGLSISPKIIGGKRNHDNKNKPNRLAVRLDNALRSQVQEIYERMCFVTMQDLLEAAIAEFVRNHGVRE